jgi:hypothetical protein
MAPQFLFLISLSFLKSINRAAVLKNFLSIRFRHRKFGPPKIVKVVLNAFYSVVLLYNLKLLFSGKS